MLWSKVDSLCTVDSLNHWIPTSVKVIRHWMQISPAILGITFFQISFESSIDQDQLASIEDS